MLVARISTHVSSADKLHKKAEFEWEFEQQQHTKFVQPHTAGE